VDEWNWIELFEHFEVVDNSALFVELLSERLAKVGRKITTNAPQHNRYNTQDGVISRQDLHKEEYKMAISVK